MPDAIDTDRLILVVTGAHLRSEVGDRPLAYKLRQSMIDWMDRHFGSDQRPYTVVVSSDIWVMNNDELRGCPTVSIGGPGVNAFAAYLADKLESAFVVEDVLMVQLDLDFDDLIASCWGMDHASTVAAVSAFEDKYLDGFMEAAMLRMDVEID
ncbi:MAG: hypothetical protein VYC34_11550 [Planctomycetota bacterium]|nr:hypothetical protein [Planctomycetota bacterium]